MSSYRKLYYVGFTFFLFFLLLVVYSLYVISDKYDLLGSNSSNITTDSSMYQPDTIYQEKIVEKLRVDTLKIFVPVKPKVEVKDTTTVPSSSTSNQSQN